MTQNTAKDIVLQLEEGLDKLSRLGNAPHLGNSIGNGIAQDLAKLIPTLLAEIEKPVSLEKLMEMFEFELLKADFHPSSISYTESVDALQTAIDCFAANVKYEEE